MENGVKNLLKTLGLSEDQAKVYLAALELGQGSMQDLARKSGVKRTSIYNFIKELVDQKFIFTSQKSKRVVYSAVHPNQLLEIQKARLAELDRTLPELLAIHNRSANKPRVTFHEGVDGIKEVLLDMLKEKQPVSAWSDYKAMADAFGDYYFDVFPPERARRGIVSKNIVPDTSKARDFAKNDAKYLRESKFLDMPAFKTEINIYGNKIALNSYRAGNPFAVLIEDENLAETLRTIWQQQWNQANNKINQ